MDELDLPEHVELLVLEQDLEQLAQRVVRVLGLGLAQVQAQAERALVGGTFRGGLTIGEGEAVVGV